MYILTYRNNPSYSSMVTLVFHSVRRNDDKWLGIGGEKFKLRYQGYPQFCIYDELLKLKDGILFANVKKYCGLGFLLLSLKLFAHRKLCGKAWTHK